MTKARDLANIISTGVPNSLITLDAAEIPNISTDKLTSGTLPDARIADLSATKLTGTVNNARISLDAAEIPNLDTAKLTTGTLATARLGSGTADATTFLRGDQSYAAAGGGAWNYISTTTGSSASSVTITGLDSTYDFYMYIITLDGDTDSVLNYMRTEVGGSIISTSSYKYAIMQSYSGSTTPNAYNSASATAIRLNSDGVEADANNPLDIIMYSHNPSNTNYLYKTFQFHGTNKQHDGSLQNWKGSGVYESASAVTGIQIYPASGTYRTYTIRLYGLANS